MNRDIERLILQSERLCMKSAVLQSQAQAMSHRLAALINRCDQTCLSLEGESSTAEKPVELDESYHWCAVAESGLSTRAR